MSETLKVLESRRSCRAYKPELIEEEKLQEAAPRKENYVYYIR